MDASFCFVLLFILFFVLLLPLLFCFSVWFRFSDTWRYNAVYSCFFSFFLLENGPAFTSAPSPFIAYISVPKCAVASLLACCCCNFYSWLCFRLSFLSLLFCAQLLYRVHCGVLLVAVFILFIIKTVHFCYRCCCMCVLPLHLFCFLDANKSNSLCIHVC